MEPVLHPPGAVSPTPGKGTAQTVTAPGDDWKLDTDGMQLCGYIVRVHARDLAIVDSQTRGLRRADSAGFCQAEPEEYETVRGPAQPWSRSEGGELWHQSLGQSPGSLQEVLSSRRMDWHPHTAK